MISIGDRFGRVTVIGQAPPVGDRSRRAWLLRCDCGHREPWSVLDDNLKRDRIHSCGCFRREFSATQHRTHGQAGKGRRSPEYTVWALMIQRCEDVNVLCYPRYGGRGITVCQRWRDSFEDFLADMGPRPAGLTIERVDNDKGYEPGNCVWATPMEQAQNTRNVQHVMVLGEDLSVSAAARRLQVPAHRINNPVRRLGMTHQAAVDMVIRQIRMGAQ